jgi:hypothetical protein
MSTTYRPLASIRTAALFDGRLTKFGVQEFHPETATPDTRCLTDGGSFLWVSEDENGLVYRFSRYAGSVPEHILRAIVDEFDVDVVSEHQPEYYGCRTVEELDELFARIANEIAKDEKDFYIDVARFVRGESHGIKPGTIRSVKAGIAKRLIAESPELLADDKRPDLIKAVDLVDRKECEDDIAF